MSHFLWKRRRLTFLGQQQQQHQRRVYGSNRFPVKQPNHAYVDTYSIRTFVVNSNEDFVFFIRNNDNIKWWRGTTLEKLVDENGFYDGRNIISSWTSFKMSKMSALNYYFISECNFHRLSKGKIVFFVSLSSLVVITMAAVGAAPMSSHYDTATAHAKRERM